MMAVADPHHFAFLYPNKLHTVNFSVAECELKGNLSSEKSIWKAVTQLKISTQPNIWKSWSQ